jgi:integrase
MKLTLGALRSAKPGRPLADPAVPGLRYLRSRKGVLYAQLRFKGSDGAWRSYGLGAVDINQRALLSQLETAAFLTSMLGPRRDDTPMPKEALELGLEPVRRKAIALRLKLRAGDDPRHGGPTFGALADLFLERKVAKEMRPRSQKEYQRHVGRFLAAWERRPIASITRADVVAELDKLEDKHGPVARNRALAVLGSLFTFTLKREAIPASPAAKVDMLPERPRERWLRDDELARLWAAFDALGHPWGSWGKMLALTGQRREQCAQMRWEEVDFDNAVWYARQKGDREVLVPLAPMALALLRGLRPADGGSGYVFTSRTRRGAKAGARTHIQHFTHAKRLVLAALGEPPLEHWQFHDLRRTVSTGLSRLRVPPHIRELVLGHAVMDRLVKTYDRHDYLDEKRDALCRWEAHVERVVSGAANVLPLTAARGAA